jgi:hypothetical protein
MSMTQVRSDTAMEPPRARTVDMKLKVVVIPVSDVDRAKSFYSNLGWWRKADADLLLTCVLSAVGQSGKQESRDLQDKRC